MDFTASDSFIVMCYESVDDRAVLIEDSPFVREIQIEFPSVRHGVD